MKWVLLVYVINAAPLAGTNSVLPALATASFQAKGACEQAGKWVVSQRAYAKGADIPKWICIEDK